MATLQKFKILARQCTTAAGTMSPSRSPLPSASPSSPGFHLRRHRNRKTLRGLLGRSSSSSSSSRRCRGEIPPPDRPSRSLKDLFVSSPPPSSRGAAPTIPEAATAEEGGGRGRRFGIEGIGWGVRRAGQRIGSAGLRGRLLRRVWRPVLVAIPE
ncbi:hypothetical protein QJS10_CPA01g01601 [Acorus calamus]|uniref:Uncharacterized protein n=1 Tax=Acorus calamus TaxID=4465 RepID=A0AAV9FJZ2_ACOCL|nr:hypothetical protein QJS10_CPA01g01601 [Acorus calamus]